jgi:hypothetical protein
MKYFAIILAILTLTSCSKPGYSTRITISKDAGTTKSDINLITNILHSKSYNTIKIEEKATWKIASYKIILDDERFNALERRYIGLAVEYSCAGKNASQLKDRCEIEVRIGNHWEGKNPIVKEVIDKITDQVVANLLKKFSKSEISISRAYTSPM